MDCGSAQELRPCGCLAKHLTPDVCVILFLMHSELLGLRIRRCGVNKDRPSSALSLLVPLALATAAFRPLLGAVAKSLAAARTSSKDKGFSNEHLTMSAIGFKSHSVVFCACSGRETAEGSSECSDRAARRSAKANNLTPPCKSPAGSAMMYNAAGHPHHLP